MIVVISPFKQHQREDFAHILTSDEHDQLIVYYAKKGSPRDIRAIVEPDDMVVEMDENLSRAMRLEVTLSKDENNEVLLDGMPANHGGVRFPERGDQIWLKEWEHPVTDRYTFTGVVIEEKFHSWTLEFKAFKTIRTGAIHVKSQL